MMNIGEWAGRVKQSDRSTWRIHAHTNLGHPVTNLGLPVTTGHDSLCMHVQLRLRTRAMTMHPLLGLTSIPSYKTLMLSKKIDGFPIRRA